ncbi:Sugar kinase of the NBD/HSP70 family, may contain an N-terminal HTH domain [Paramicrobacterium humi]|uniref:Sugar kinase of the NBD/HSP70 family, may contain an N-terminal HTH domain n=1 Tax=Paramicrobacterium humi TaxID=640635 RepID=A0A1H4MXQ4_9MICO|nr:ROK family transcriptional regulator [Microbacterium humi]SEB87554.1 Sugar kinase of the NBD/HSP70 family, may contain an N-terminal HTH domain [Microbacterium humi]
MAVRGNNLDTVRRHNLSTVIGLVHRDGPLSRSELTALTGLNRSTVAALVTELTELGLAVELSPDATRKVGRPSPLVTANRNAVALAVNPEIDAITVAVVGLDMSVRSLVRREVEAAPSPSEAVRMTASLVAELRDELPTGAAVLGLGAAVPGLVHSADGVVRLAPHLGWQDVPIAEMLREATGLPAWAGNDASLGAVAERLFGAGNGVTDLIYLNGGASGIGGGMIFGGELLGGIGGFAGEFGHTRVAGAAVPGAALEDEVNRARLLEALGLGVADADQLEAALLSATDADAVEEIDRQVDMLSTALRNAINILNPALVVLGGFLGSLHAARTEQMTRLVGLQTLGPAFEDVAITRAALGDEILVIGAAELVFQNVLSDPAARRGSGIQ